MLLGFVHGVMNTDNMTISGETIDYGPCAFIDLENLIELSKHLETKGVDLVVLDQGVDTSTAAGKMFFQILGAIAEFEHALMSERTRDGLAAARARGRTGGQKPKLGPRQVKLARQMYEETGADGKRRYTVQQVADEFGVSRPTIYRHLDSQHG
ncbi:recombinase family protein [Nocardioides panacisoli]|uniref:recombinase family protein n=1 Tax=Nocardioides panacisoli TaxID=627624 RepID=UPI002357577C|nr:protein adenylyltransferase SelO family protein [Nocardioides panacisoli]